MNHFVWFQRNPYHSIILTLYSLQTLDSKTNLLRLVYFNLWLIILLIYLVTARFLAMENQHISCYLFIAIEVLFHLEVQSVTVAKWITYLIFLIILTQFLLDYHQSKFYLFFFLSNFFFMTFLNLYEKALYEYIYQEFLLQRMTNLHYQA